MTTTNTQALGTFYGDEEFPIEWKEGERELFWIYDDLHIPNPVSPMFFDIGGWWLTSITACRGNRVPEPLRSACPA